MFVCCGGLVFLMAFLHQQTSNVFGCHLSSDGHMWYLYFLGEEHFQERRAMCLNFTLRDRKSFRSFVYIFLTPLVTYCAAVDTVVTSGSKASLWSAHVPQKDLYMAVSRRGR